jgi:hypothetical protein
MGDRGNLLPNHERAIRPGLYALIKFEELVAISAILVAAASFIWYCIKIGKGQDRLTDNILALMVAVITMSAVGRFLYRSLVAKMMLPTESLNTMSMNMASMSTAMTSMSANMTSMAKDMKLMVTAIENLTTEIKKSAEMHKQTYEQTTEILRVIQS